MERNVLDVLEVSFQSLWADTVLFLPELLVAIAVVIIGWIIGGVLCRVVERIFQTLKLNEALDRAGADRLVDKAGYKLQAGKFVGSLVKWFIIIVFFVTALDILGLNDVTIFFREVVLGYLPKVIVAVLILLVAMVVANVAAASVRAGAQAAGFASAGLLGSITRYAIIVFATLAALSQLEIAPALVETLFMGIVFATSLALGLAFGLGGRETAAKYISKLTGGNNDHQGHI